MRDGKQVSVHDPYFEVPLLGAAPWRALKSLIGVYTYYKDGAPLKPSQDHTTADFAFDNPCQEVAWTADLPGLCIADPFRVGKAMVFPCGRRVDGKYRLVFESLNDATGAQLARTEFALPAPDKQWPGQFFVQDGADVGLIPWWNDRGTEPLMISNWPDWGVGPVENGGLFERLLVWRDDPRELSTPPLVIPKLAMSPNLPCYEVKGNGTVSERWRISSGSGDLVRLWTPIGVSGQRLIANYEEWQHTTVADVFGLGSFTAGFIFYEMNLDNPIASSGKRPGEVGYRYGENFLHQDWPPPYPTDAEGNSYAFLPPYPPSGTYGGSDPPAHYVTEADFDKIFKWFVAYWGGAASGVSTSGPHAGHILYWINRTSQLCAIRHVRGLASINVKTGDIIVLRPGDSESSVGRLLAGKFRVGWWKSPVVPTDGDPSEHGVCLPYSATDSDSSLKSIYIPADVPEPGDERCLFDNEWAVSAQTAEAFGQPDSYLPDGPVIGWEWLRSNTSLHGTFLPEYERWREGKPNVGTPPVPAWGGTPRRFFVTARMWVESVTEYPIVSGKKTPADTTSGVFDGRRFRLMPRPASEWSEWNGG